MDNLINNTPQTPEDRMMALMRNKSQIDPGFSSGELTMPDYSQVLQNRSVGTNQPDTQPNIQSDDFSGDFSSYVKGLADKFGISQKFGNKSNMYKSGSHPGLDIRTPSGTQITSPIGGKVKMGFDPKGWGRYVQVIDPNGGVIQFSHLSETDPMIQDIIKSGGVIKKGQVIGKTGGSRNDPNRGLSTGAHLDISYKAGDKFINPLGG